MFTPTLCLALLLSSTEPEPSNAIEVRTYNLAAVIPRIPDASFHRVSLLPMREYHYADDFGREHPELEPLLTAAQVQFLIRNVVHPEEWEYAERFIEEYDRDGSPHLTIGAPPQILSDVERLLDFLGQALNPAIEVRLAVHRTRSGADLSTLPLGRLNQAGPQKLNRLATEGSLSWPREVVLSLSSGVPAPHFSTTDHTYVRDYDTEIAQAATQLQPVVDIYPTGLAAVVRADSLGDGRQAISLLLRDSWIDEEPEKIRLRMESRIVPENGVETVLTSCDIESPRVTFATLTSRMVLAEGETRALLASTPSTSSRDNGVLVTVTLSRSENPNRNFRSGDRILEILELGGHLASATTPSVPASLFSSEGRPGREMDEPIKELSLGAPRYGTQAERAIEHAQDPSGVNPVSIRRGGLVFVVGAEQQVDPFVTKVRAWIEPPHDTGTTLLSIEDGGTTVPLAAVSSVGGAAIAAAGSQELFVIDYDVDVANNAANQNPNIGALVNGYALALHPRGARAGEEQFGLTMKSHFQVGERVDFLNDVSDFGVIHNVEFTAAFVDADASVASGAADQVGQIPLPSGELAPVTLKSQD